MVYSETAAIPYLTVLLCRKHTIMRLVLMHTTLNPCIANRRSPHSNWYMLCPLRFRRTDLSIAKFPIRWFWISTQCASNFYLSIISKHLYTDDSSPWVSPITWNCAIAPRPYSPTEGAKFENIVKILFDIWGLFYFLSIYCYKTCFVCFGRYCNAT
jgi:hypothetical protein